MSGMAFTGEEPNWGCVILEVVVTMSVFLYAFSLLRGMAGPPNRRPAYLLTRGPEGRLLLNLGEGIVVRPCATSFGERRDVTGFSLVFRTCPTP